MTLLAMVFILVQLPRKSHTVEYDPERYFHLIGSCVTKDGSESGRTYYRDTHRCGYLCIPPTCSGFSLSPDSSLTKWCETYTTRGLVGDGNHEYLCHVKKEKDIFKYIDETPAASFYPYQTTIPVMARKVYLLPGKRHEVDIYTERHVCPPSLSDTGVDLAHHRELRFGFRRELLDDSMRFWFQILRGFRTEVNRTVVLTDLRGAPMLPESMQILSVQVMYHVMQISVNYLPVKEVFINGDEYSKDPAKIDDTYSSWFSGCKEVIVYNGPGNDKAVAHKVCSFYTAHKYWDFHDAWGWSQCNSRDKNPCHTGYCIRGECETSQFGDGCKCWNKKWTKDVRKRPYLGEYCSEDKQEVVEASIRATEAYETEIEFDNVNGSVVIELVPNFNDWNYQYFFLRVYKLMFGAFGIRQKLVKYENDETATATDESKVFTFEGAEPNTSYLIATYGRQSLIDPSNYTFMFDNQSFVHFTEIHTPGYSLLTPPVHLNISLVPVSGNLFNISWNYEGDIPPQEYLVIVRSGLSLREEEVTHDEYDYLALKSNMSYNISVSSVNAIGAAGPESQPIIFTTPVYKYDSKSFGKYDFAKWFFSENGILMDDRFVYFKNTVRRDIRIERVAITLNATLTPTLFSDRDASAVYQAALHNQTYESHEPRSPYITASFNKGENNNITLPRRVLVGDQGIYDRYLNGELDNSFVYQTHVIVWYKSGRKVEVSVQYLGVISLSNIPWITIFIAIAVGTTSLTILSGLFNCLFYRIVLGHRLKKAQIVKQTLSAKSLLVEQIYDNVILANADYDITDGSGEIEIQPSTFSLMD